MITLASPIAFLFALAKKWKKRIRLANSQSKKEQKVIRFSEKAEKSETTNDDFVTRKLSFTIDLATPITFVFALVKNWKKRIRLANSQCKEEQKVIRFSEKAEKSETTNDDFVKEGFSSRWFCFSNRICIRFSEKVKKEDSLSEFPMQRTKGHSL